ncbi:hypothetical protein HPB48_000051 [Haemaphysalis longicornis]|uniref:C2H2-type domain-containing protein n=1 Tax=Haemaphysalis longicornis TaxID=44386 RepID=A0A9J6FXA8_HAELO|nr:hypothetical protein HPB48_000051 [Haemaphysalis longicornis]
MDSLGLRELARQIVREELQRTAAGTGAHRLRCPLAELVREEVRQAVQVPEQVDVFRQDEPAPHMQAALHQPVYGTPPIVASVTPQHTLELSLRTPYLMETGRRNSDLWRTPGQHASLLPLTDRPYKCPVCHKSFAWKAYMETHARRHSGDKPFKCKVCAKAFVTSHNLLAHSSIHTTEKPHNCSLCPQARTDHCQSCSRSFVVCTSMALSTPSSNPSACCIVALTLAGGRSLWQCSTRVLHASSWSPHALHFAA